MAPESKTVNERVCGAFTSIESGPSVTMLKRPSCIVGAAAIPASQPPQRRASHIDNGLAQRAVGSFARADAILLAEIFDFDNRLHNASPEPLTLRPKSQLSGARAASSTKASPYWPQTRHPMASLEPCGSIWGSISGHQADTYWSRRIINEVTLCAEYPRQRIVNQARVVIFSIASLAGT